MKKVTLLLIIVIITSCKQKIEEFYDNGNLKAVYYLKKSKKDGIYKEFFNNNILKETHIYFDGKKVDSSIFYHSPPLKNSVKRIQYWGDKRSLQVNYDIKGNKVSEGYTLNNKGNMNIDTWSFYSNNKKDSIREYLDIDNRSYLNQIWYLDSNGDTLKTKGNYFKITHKDTIALGEIIRFRVELYQPYFSYSSDAEVILPFYDEDLKDDFSNLYEIEIDTFHSLKNDKIPHPEVPEHVMQNHVIEFGLDYEEAGEKRIRGVLVEYNQRYKSNFINKDSLERVERRLYFDTTFFIKK